MVAGLTVQCEYGVMVLMVHILYRDGGSVVLYNYSTPIKAVRRPKGHLILAESGSLKADLVLYSLIHRDLP